MDRTLLIKDPRYINHITRAGHPESPQRLEAVYGMLEQSDMRDMFRVLEPRPASKEEIILNHEPGYVETIADTAGKGCTFLDPDTNTSEGSWEAAILAAGGVLIGIDSILNGEADNAFALVRPPGHHAEAGRAMGFCLFNNVAIGAHYLMTACDIKKILIVDWDIHHGNGTQNSFYNSSDVLYFSSHQYPYYPGSGAFEETGAGAGRGYTINVPLSGGQGDKDYLYLYRHILNPVAEQFRPEFILVSAGYDIYQSDPLGTMNVTPEGFGCLAFYLKDLAQRLCGGRILLTLEGGYHIQGITESIQHTVRALAGMPGYAQDANRELDGSIHSSTVNILRRVRSIHGSFWHGFADRAE